MGNSPCQNIFIINGGGEVYQIGKKLILLYHNIRSNKLIGKQMNSNNPNLESFDNARLYEQTLSKEKRINSNQNFNPSFWKSDHEIPFNILTPSPLRNVPFPTSLNDEKVKRFEDWSFYDLCLNRNVNRNMENLIEDKINFNSDNENEEIDKEDEIGPDQRKKQFDDDFSDKNYRTDYFREKKIRPKDKGLRRLSEKSFQIVRRLGSTTYKEVALKLIDQLQSEAEIEREEKQEQNIKRRVYDALNVLIALGILKKEGRQIIYDERQIRNKRKNRKMLYEQKKREAKEREQILRKKKQTIAALYDDIQMKKLINRNMLQPSQQTICLPFLVLQFTNNKKENLEIEIENSEKFRMKGKKPSRQIESKEFIQYLNLSN